MSTARVFIGAPTEDGGLAVALQELLEKCSSARVWNQKVFEANRGSLESLFAAVDEYDFACFLAPPVDVVETRNETHPVTRDNIIFEYGLFLGRLGPDRVFLIHPRTTELALPSDLKGVTLLTYKEVDDENPASAVLAPPAQTVERNIKDLGPRVKQRRYNPVLERGTVDRVAGVSDAALYYMKPRYGYKDAIRSYVLAGEVIPSLYYYVTQDGAEFWLSMSSNPHYRFKSNSTRLIRRTASEIAETIRQHTDGDGAIDLISLGSGDGAKDRNLLEGLIKTGTSSIAYYPLDISDTLIVECIRNVHGGAFDYAGVQTKAIIGDFMDLQVLRSVYEDRATPNVFSVLGNTFGNTDEAEITEALQNAMYPGDFVLIEINCDLAEVGSQKSFLTSEETLRYSCIPLEMLDIKVNVKKVSVQEEELSIFSCARSSATLYEQVSLEGRTISDVRLACDHRYPRAEFEKELADTLEVDVLFSEQYGNAAVLLAKKPA